jgi:hypothetical protein
MRIERLADIHVPTTLVAELAAEAAVAWCSRALMEHNHRAYLWAAARGREMGIPFDEELLYVAAMFHDLGLVPAFDNATVSFDEAGGNVAWMFAAGAGWPIERRVRLGEVIVRHMWESVDPAFDAEGHLLEVGTAIDISGRDPDLWAPSLRAEVLAAHPRLDLATEFTACFRDQARRKPDSSAAAAMRSGMADRIAANILDRADAGAAG